MGKEKVHEDQPIVVPDSATTEHHAYSLSEAHRSIHVPHGASFLRMDGRVWTTDKDGLILALLAAEITARTGKDPGEHYREITAAHGDPIYIRIDQAATPTEKARLKQLSPAQVKSSTLAGEAITAVSRRRTAGSPRGRRARRTSTRFMPRASTARPTWTA